MSAANLLLAAGNRGRVVGLVKAGNLNRSFVAVAVLAPHLLCSGDGAVEWSAPKFSSRLLDYLYHM